MSHPILDLLRSDDLHANTCSFSTAPALRRFLSVRSEIATIREAMRAGQLTDENVRLFVGSALARLKGGVLFADDITLAALAVALQDRLTPFADEFLSGLAGLEIGEMPLAPRVAREILAWRGREGFR